LYDYYCSERPAPFVRHLISIAPHAAINQTWQTIDSARYFLVMAERFAGDIELNLHAGVSIETDEIVGVGICPSFFVAAVAGAVYGTCPQQSCVEASSADHQTSIPSTGLVKCHGQSGGYSGVRVVFVLA
jgi:hypothetical protein